MDITWLVFPAGVVISIVGTAIYLTKFVLDSEKHSDKADQNIQWEVDIVKRDMEVLEERWSRHDTREVKRKEEIDNRLNDHEIKISSVNISVAEINVTLKNMDKSLSALLESTKWNQKSS